MENGAEPATKQDLENFKVEVNMRFERFEHRLEGFLQEMEGRIVTSTYRLAESMNARIRAEEHASAAIKDRLDIIETRLTELERRSNMPPQAPKA